jgi:Protein of unknown function (DUF3141)
VLLSDRNPLTLAIAPLAEAARQARKPVAPSNPFFQTEQMFAGLVEQTMDFWRDVKSAVDELSFYAIYANPFMARLAERDASTPDGGLDATLREMPDVSKALQSVGRGGYAEAVIRMLVLMAHSRGSVRQSRLERSNEILQRAEPFQSLGYGERTRMIREQTLIIDFEPKGAVAALPTLLPDIADRNRAIALVEEIAGDPGEMSEPTVRMLAGLREALGLPANAALQSADRGGARQ